MRLAAFLLLFALADGPARPEQAIPYFTNVRELHIAEPDKQNYFVVDEELWAHSRPDLGDLRLYDDATPVQYYLAEQRAGVSSDEVDAKILNLGGVAGHTEFDIDAEGLAEYDRIRLHIDAHDFVATASVSGGAAPGKAAEVQLAPSTLYDFTKEQLGTNLLLKLPPSSFRYLHIKLSPGIRAEQVKGASIYNLHDRHLRTSWEHPERLYQRELPQTRTSAVIDGDSACVVPAERGRYGDSARQPRGPGLVRIDGIRSDERDEAAFLARSVQDEI